MAKIKFIVKNFFFICILFISACTTSVPAPIINGWHQPAAKYSNYRVQNEDTLYSIAWAFNIDYKILAKINHLSPPYSLRAGQLLKMSAMPLQKFSYQKLQFINTWCWPTKGQVIRQFSLLTNGDKGIDFHGKFAQPVIATAGGTVVYSGSGLRGYGNLIIIKHNETYLSAYAYNNKLLVKEGACVKIGQIIALMGNRTNNRLEPGQLHFEIRQNGKPINPLLLLR